MYPINRGLNCPPYDKIIDKKTGKSQVWVHFGLPADNSGKILADSISICKICLAPVSSKGGSTTNLLSHLKVYHPATFMEIKSVKRQISNIQISSYVNENVDDPCKDFSANKSDVPLVKKQKTILDFQPLDVNSSKKCTDSLTKFLVGTMMPLNLVESEFFINYTKTLNPRYKLPSRKSITKTAVPKLYNDVAEKIKIELLSADSNNVCVTTDCWTSLANTAYIAVTAHFIDTEWNFKSVCLCCRQFEENHTSENITEELKDILSDWNLDAEKITCYTTDNGPNIVKAIKMLNVLQMPCFGHTINIGINKALLIPAVKKAISRLKKLQSTVAHSWKMSRDLTKAQEFLHMDVLSLPSACITRWWSILKLCNRFLQNQLPICKLLQDYPEKKHLMIENSEITALEELVKATADLEGLTKNLSSEKYTTASSVLPLLRKIKKGLKVTDTDNSLLKEIKTKISATLDSYYQEKNLMSLLRLSSFCDPRFKLNFVDDPGETKALALSKMTQMYTEKDFISPTVKKNNEPVDALELYLEGEEDEVEILDDCALPTKKAESEINNYLCMPKIRLSENPLLWWKMHEKNFPALKVLAKKYMCIQGSSVPSERVFSTGGNIITKHRASLLPKNAERLVFLAQNKKYF